MKNLITVANKKFIVKLLTLKDASFVQQLCERCSDFSMLIEGKSPEKNAGHEILTDLPPDKELCDKFVFGVFNFKNSLIAIIDMVRNYKDIGEWTLGLLLLDPGERGNGLGRNIHEFVKSFVLENHGKKLRLGVVEENKKAYKFWTEMGYSEVNRVKATYGIKEHVVIVMSLYLL